MPLFWAIWEFTGLTETKYGHRIGQRGTCTLYMNSAPTRYCDST